MLHYFWGVGTNSPDLIPFSFDHLFSKGFLGGERGEKKGGGRGLKKGWGVWG